MISINEKINCSGCTACANICPNQCIEMVSDNEGFKYPMVDITKCSNCKLCVLTCPIKIKNKKNLSKEETIVYAVQNKDNKAREKSSAGGFYAAIAEYVLSENGVVFGAGFDDDMMVCHMSVSSFEEWENSSLCGSKYVQSDLGHCFSDVKMYLSMGKKVCFSGLPCQVAGLQSFLKRKYDNLILIDLTCYGAPSPKLYRKYLDFCENKYNSKIIGVNFRDKKYGYSSPNMKLTLKNGSIKEQNSNVKSYLRSFFCGISSRPSCYHCEFKTVERVSDFTLGDCKSIGKFYYELDDDKGTTIVYVHSTKGKELLERLDKNVVKRLMDKDQVLKTCGKKMITSDRQNPEREHFFKDIDVISYEDLINKYVPTKFDEKLANLIKPTLYKMGLVNLGVLKKMKKLRWKLNK